MKAVDGQVARKQVQRDRAVAGAGRASEIAQRLVEQPPAPPQQGPQQTGQGGEMPQRRHRGADHLRAGRLEGSDKGSAIGSPAFEGAQAGGVVDAEDQDHPVEETSFHLR